MRAALSALLVASAVAAGCATMKPPTTTFPAPAPAPGGVGPTMSRMALRHYIDSLVDVPEFRSTNWGLLVVDPGRGETLYARNADKLFMPASNQKLITGSTAITQLGLGHRW